MKTHRITYLFSFLILAIGIAIAIYLLFHHFNIISGQANTSDLCQVIFGKGCSNTSFSSLSTFLKIPLGGWGLIYFTILGLLLIIDLWLINYFENDLVKLAFWISLVGISFSVFYLVYMILYPLFFCPFCAIFHGLNIILFFIIKKITNTSYIDLFHSLIRALKLIALGKSGNTALEKWKWLVYILPFIVALVLYQWVRIEGLGQTISKLATYNPLEELENFDNQVKFEINLNSNTPVLGLPEAPVTMVVFSDFQCSNCGMFASNFTELVNYNEGKLNIKFKYFPLDQNCNPLVKEEFHLLGCLAAFAVEAAHLQGKFWVYHDSLYARNPNSFIEDTFYEVAEEVGLDMNKFTTDFKSEKCQSKIANDVAEGIKLELDGTPSVFLNGRRVYDLRPENLNFLIRYLSSNIALYPEDHSN